MGRTEDLFEQDHEDTAQGKNKRLSDLLLAVWSHENLSEICRVESTGQTPSGWAAMRKKDP